MSNYSNPHRLIEKEPYPTVEINPPPTQLDRIEAKLDQLLAKKKPDLRVDR